MAWVPPTYDEFLLRFPVFSTYNPELGEYILDDTNMRVAEGNWADHDKTPASLNLTAQRLYMTPGAIVDDGSGSGGGGGVLLGAVKSRTVGDARVEYETGSSPSSGGGGGGVSASAGPLAEFYLTPYGRHYLYLMKLNFPAVAVVYR